MVKSMTAFGRGRIENEAKTVTVEIKSVNSRFFDCNVKCPRQYLFMEEKIKEHIRQGVVSRAKVDVFVTVQAHTADVGVITLDKELARKYIEALKELRDGFDLKDDISTMTVARNQELFSYEKPEEDLEGEWQIVKSALELAAADYTKMREAEGEKARLDISQKIEAVRELTDKIEELSISDAASFKEKFETRIRQLLSDAKVSVDENRILTECAIFTDKIAIDEELVRLRSHFGAFYDIISSSEPSGRKLDFLMQELNRETNTIGSKANNASIARLVVEVKGILEKIREQVQNIE